MGLLIYFESLVQKFDVHSVKKTEISESGGGHITESLSRGTPTPALGKRGEGWPVGM